MVLVWVRMLPMEKLSLGLIWYFIFLFSTVCHEAAHAWAGMKLGDKTAYEGGQVSLNPIPHMLREPVGILLAPLFTFFSYGWMMGWASTPYNFQWALNYPKKSALMSLAGPVANLALVVLAALGIHAGIWAGVLERPAIIHFSSVVVAAQPGYFGSVATFLSILFTLNLLLFSFNLLPLPPLDGSGVIALFLGEAQARKFLVAIHHPILSLLAFIVAWNFFYIIFDPVHTVALNLLYPGSNFQ